MSQPLYTHSTSGLSRHSIHPPSSQTREYATLSMDEFMAEYASKGKPVVLTGCTHVIIVLSLLCPSDRCVNLSVCVHHRSADTLLPRCVVAGV